MRNKSLYCVPVRQGLNLHLVGRALPVNSTYANTPNQPPSHTQIVWLLSDETCVLMLDLCESLPVCWRIFFSVDSELVNNQHTAMN